MEVVMKIKLKNPDILEAFLWTGGPEQIEDPWWIVEAISKGRAFFTKEGTPEVKMYLMRDDDGIPLPAKLGDYIVNNGGNIFPLSPDDFNKTFEPDFEEKDSK